MLCAHLPLCASIIFSSFVWERLQVAAIQDSIPVSEMNALWSLYNSTDGENWIWYDPSYPQYFEGAVWNFTPSANPCTDQWQGVTCSIELAHVTNLSLPLHGLNGSIPQEIGQLTQLQVLVAAYNMLFGSIPVEIGQLTRLRYLDLSNNALSQYIPAEIGQLTQLQLLDLDTNALAGSVPGQIGQLTHLQWLYLYSNELSGSIPAEIGRLTHLLGLYLESNKLTGSISLEITLLTQLRYLYLYSNQLSGGISTEIGQLTQMQYLSIDVNHLSGPIPGEIGQLSQLRQLFVDSNDLSGGIPAEIGQLTQIQVLDLDSNQLSGSIPAEIGRLTQLQGLYLYSNALSGSIPTEIGLLTLLRVLDCDRNALSGTIPAEFGQIEQLFFLVMFSNHLTGTIPAEIGQLTELQGLDLDSNALSGTIPAEFGQLTMLQGLHLGSNKLSSSVPAEVGLLLNLQVVDLYTNHLSGSVPAGIGHLTRLEYVNLADNAFSGSIPDELFQLANLSALIAGKNCFEGTLPQAVCGATALVSLNLDGLHTARQCSKRQVPITYVYGGAEAFRGAIPDCIFSLPLLTSLHLSGNGFTGTIPANLSTDAVLVDLVLSHNSLVGSIPASIQLRAWDTLDLSYNRLGGTLQPAFGSSSVGASITNASVYLKNNRLSGRIPDFLVQLSDVQILGSNIFSCDADRSDLPAHDEDRDRYQCGSNAFVGHLIAALVVIAAVLVLMSVMFGFQCNKSVVAAVGFAGKWFREARRGSVTLPAGAALFCTIGMLFRDVAMWCALTIVLCLIPWYAAVHSQYGTYTHTYAWVVSAAFLSGLVPAVTELVLYCALMTAVVIGGALLVVKSGKPGNQSWMSNFARSQQNETPCSGRAPTAQWYQGLPYTLFFATNLTVVLLVNVGFVAASLQADHAVLTIAQILYTAFKLFWNMVCTPYMIDLVTAYTGRRRVCSSLVTTHTLLSILNNIVIPCLVVAVQSPSCFLNVFQASPTVDAEYSVPGCEAIPFVDSDGAFSAVTVCTYQYPVPLSLQFQPHFSYSYQCSSSFITYYSPVFVLMGLTAGVLIPVAKAVSLYWLTRAVPGTRWHRVLRTVVPRILRPIASVAPPLSDQETLHITPAALLRQLREERVFNGVTAISALTTYLGILLTFGVVFPPLAVIMCATMWSVHWQTRLMLGKFVHDAQAAGAMHLIERLEQDCRSVVSMQALQRVMFLITCICCCFYALFLFDTLGDARGAADSYWIFLVMSLFPVVLYVLNRAHRTREGMLGTAGRGGFQADEDNMFEMATVGAVSALQVQEGSSQETIAAASHEKAPSAGNDVGDGVAGAAGATISVLHSDA